MLSTATTVQIHGTQMIEWMWITKTKKRTWKH